MLFRSMICYVLAMGKQHLGPHVVVGYGIKMFWPGLFITSPDHLAEQSFYLLKTRTICVIFLYNCMQCIDGFSILLQRYVIKGNDEKNPAIFSFCLLSKEPS